MCHVILLLTRQITGSIGSPTTIAIYCRKLLLENLVMAIEGQRLGAYSLNTLDKWRRLILSETSTNSNSSLLTTSPFWIPIKLICTYLSSRTSTYNLVESSSEKHLVELEKHFFWIFLRSCGVIVTSLLLLPHQEWLRLFSTVNEQYTLPSNCLSM